MKSRLTFLALCLLFLYGISSHGADKPLTGVEQNLCPALGRLSQSTRNTQAFQNLHTDPSGKLTLPEDRVAIRLATDLNSPILKLLTPQGVTEFESAASQLPELGPFVSALAHRPVLEPELVAMLAKPDAHPLVEMLDLRGREDWDSMIQVYEKRLTTAERRYAHILLQAALAYNRRGKDQDVEKALQITQTVLDNKTLARDSEVLSEAYGIRARIYKDRYSKSKDKQWLNLAIETYLTGFEVDLLNYYPAMAALDLLWLGVEPEHKAQAEALLPMVRTAVEHALTMEKNTWAIGTYLNILIWERDWAAVDKVLPEFMASGLDTMRLRSKLDSLNYIAAGWELDPKVTHEDRARLQKYIDQFAAAVKQSQQLAMPSLRLKKSFPPTEGAVNVSPLVLPEQIRAAGIAQDIDKLKPGVIANKSIHRFLRDWQAESNPSSGVLLGVTGPYRKAVAALARRTGHTPWWNAYGQMGLKLDERNTPEFLDNLAKTRRPVAMLIPKDFSTRHHNSVTWNEYQWILKNSERLRGQVEFVYGAYDLIGLDFYKQVSERQGNRYSDKHMLNVIRALQDFLTQAGDQVLW